VRGIESTHDTVTFYASYLITKWLTRNYFGGMGFWVQRMVTSQTLYPAHADCDCVQNLSVVRLPLQSPAVKADTAVKTATAVHLWTLDAKLGVLDSTRALCQPAIVLP
jgi:hypothetical protein